MPSGYFQPSIGAAGLSIPQYQSILQDLLGQFLAIYGQAVYLASSQDDYQWISAFSLKINDVEQALQLVYNARSPATAVGADLDGIVKLNGLTRKIATFSTAALLISGTSGITITNGVAQDTNGYTWALPGTVTIPPGGTITVTATCQTPGAVNALTGAINLIATPTGGWISVMNANPASAGQPIESDSQLRARQAISAALPSLSLPAGTEAGVAAVPGVTRMNYLENPTNTTDSYGNPAHSITLVVEGGTDQAIAQAIYNNRGIGCFVQGINPGSGAVTVTITDPSNGNLTLPISFFRPTYENVYVAMAIHGLVGYTTATMAAIQTAIVQYLNSLEIGESVVYSEIYGAALTQRPNPDLPLFSIRSVAIGLTPGSGTGGIFTATVAAAGTAYVVGDILTITQGGASGGQVQVTSIGSGGTIGGIAVYAFGTSYSVASALATTGGTGTGATINILSLAPTGTSDLSLLFYEVSQGLTANVVIVQV